MLTWCMVHRKMYSQRGTRVYQQSQLDPQNTSEWVLRSSKNHHVTSHNNFQSSTLEKV